MTNQLIKWFIKDYQDISNPKVRENYGKLAGIVGIITNLFLFAIKIIAGTIFKSIAITADALNNISDAGSSVITIIGFKLSEKPADKEHPYGHARAEYISGFVISLVIMFLGLELIKSSLDKIINPEPIQFSYLTVAILAIAILTKVWQSIFNKTLGKRIKSAALAATGQDSMNDVLATSAVLASTLFAKFTGIQIDGYMGIVVALFIIYSGYKLVVETLDPLLGHAPDQDLVEEVEKKILSYKGVIGLHDLVVHSYGPENWYASVHVEVPASQDVLESHDLIDTIERDVLKELNINLVIHMDPIVTDDEMTNILRGQVNEIVRKIDPELSIHDFRLAAGKTHSNLIFDVVVPTGFKKHNEELRSEIQREVSKINPNYYCVITFDRNYISSAK
ncbi:MAG: cation transporter [Clostridiaceae bacterium]|nr:cation transporter [Clostridiaceae bacterium]